MRVVKIDEVKKEVIVSPLFTGSNVTRQVLLPDSREFTVTVVNFGQGVRNKFHAHDSEQILIVTSGKGFIVTEFLFPGWEAKPLSWRNRSLCKVTAVLKENGIEK